MFNFIKHKAFNTEKFKDYLLNAINTNQYTNYGTAVQTLEHRARSMLKIDNSKAVIATSSGASALHSIILGINKEEGKKHIVSQDFTFACNMQGPASSCLIVDVDENQQIQLTSRFLKGQPCLIIVTNCFGHLQNIDRILAFADENGHKVLFDNAAAPYSFYKNTNSCNLGLGAYISLHHTKPIGFGEGGLAIIDKKYERSVRSAINFGINNNKASIHGSNFKMSDISAAAILQWWDTFDIDKMMCMYLLGYEAQKYKYLNYSNKLYSNFSDDKFFPNCLPLVHKDKTYTSSYPEEDVRKYYKPFLGLKNSNNLYDNIICLPIVG